MIKPQFLLIKKLRHQVTQQNTHPIGSKAEGIDQLQLWLEGEKIAQAVGGVMAKPKRKPLTEHLPRVEQDHEQTGSYHIYLKS